MSRRKNLFVTNLFTAAWENALTWFFAGLVIICAVAGLLGRVVTS
jgi:hypothetical protein